MAMVCCLWLQLVLFFVDFSGKSINIHNKISLNGCNFFDCSRILIVFLHCVQFNKIQILIPKSSYFFQNIFPILHVEAFVKIQSLTENYHNLLPAPVSHVNNFENNVDMSQTCVIT